jgi:uncharacterized membrane protein YfcA
MTRADEVERKMYRLKPLSHSICTALCVAIILLSVVSLASAEPSLITAKVSPHSQTPWWVWPLILFPMSFILGILSVLGGIGGATLFVPIVTSFFPFGIDFVRGAGLIVALSGSIAASPRLLRENIASFRLAFPSALIASSSSVAGALIGLNVPAYIDETFLGAIILSFIIFFIVAKEADFPDVQKPDRLSQALGIMGIYRERSLNANLKWHIHRTPVGLFAFVLVGLVAGMCGIGAGWANVAALNLIMGVPIKVAVGTSIFLISVTDSCAAWIYINSGAVLPIIVIPSVIGMMLGSRVGTKIFLKTKPKTIKWLVILLLFFAGFRIFLRGLGIWK